MYAFGRFGWARWLAAKFSPRATRAVLAATESSSFFPNRDARDIAASLRRDGYFSGLVLPADAVDQILRFAKTHPCFPDRDTTTPFYYPDRAIVERDRGERILIGRYMNTARECPAIAALQNDPLLIQIAAHYIGARPVHIGNRLWWSFVNEASELDRVRAGQAFHYDLDDWRNITFFFYLTEVGPDAGPHVLVRGSHRRKRLSWLLSIYKSRGEQTLRNYYGDDAFVTVTGPAGFGFAEDLFCFHRGSAPKQTDRLILQVRFGLCDYGNANDVRVSTRPANDMR